jgi:hypothetical protein
MTTGLQYHYGHPYLITGNSFNGPVTFQLHNSQSHNQTALSNICQQVPASDFSDRSPDAGPRRWKRIRRLSNSDGE